MKANFASLLADAESDDEPGTAAAQAPAQPEAAATTAAEPSPAGGAGAGAEGGGETRGQARRRHRKELLEVEAQCKKLTSAAKKKNKLAREMADHEAAKLRSAVAARHEAELAACPPGGDDDDGSGGEEDVGEAAAGVAGMGIYENVGAGKKKSKQQKRREAKAAEEERRYQEAKDSMVGWEDPRVMEEGIIGSKLGPSGLAVHPIKADGHCLYRALSDQCAQCEGGASERLFDLWGGDEGFLKLRRAAGEFMRQHPDDFAPFVCAEDDSGSADPYAEYLRKVEETAEWGGHLELQALSRALPAHIHVHSAQMDEQIFSPSVPCGTHLQVSYHKHAFGLGEHYNSVRKAPA